MTNHTFRVELERSGEQEPIDGGLVTFHGESYESFGEAEALQKIMPGGGASETLDLSLPGFVRWRGVLMPAADLRQVRVSLVSKAA